MAICESAARSTFGSDGSHEGQQFQAYNKDILAISLDLDFFQHLIEIMMQKQTNTQLKKSYTCIGKVSF